MKRKILYRTSVIWNLVFFQILSAAVILLLHSTYSPKGFFNLSNLQDLLIQHQNIFFLAIVPIPFVLLLSRASVFVFAFINLLIAGYCCYEVYHHFSKQTLLVSFVFIISFYFLLRLLRLEFSEPYYDPGFDSDELHDPMTTKIEGMLFSEGIELAKGYLTNWNENGFNLKVEQLPAILPKRVHLQLSFLGQAFHDEGLVVMMNTGTHSIGVKVEPDGESNVLRENWYGLNGLLEDFGYSREYLK